MTTNLSEARMRRGEAIAEKGRISENADGSFSVPSLTSTSVYQVKMLGGVWVCSCPDFQNRADQIEMCKHCYGVKLWIASRVELQEKPKPKVFADDSIQCVKCGSIKVIKFGTRKGTQTYRCNDCAMRFTPSLIKKARYSPETISLTLDLYFSGLSTQKIARTLKDHFEVELDQSTVHRWIARFIPEISEYVDSLTPQLSDTWHADEVFVKMKGGETVRGGVDRKKMDGMAYLWNVMDRKTRFLLASRLSAKRDSLGAIGAFNRAITVAHGSEPETVMTDALTAYSDTIRRVFDKKPNHVAKAGIGKPHANNNRVERLNGTIRERVKVQRGWKSPKSQIAEGQRIHYNFVKPHMALEGQTPAQAAGMNLPKGKGKWLDLMELALETKETP
jgi:transposase-like protein